MGGRMGGGGSKGAPKSTCYVLPCKIQVFQVFWPKDWKTKFLRFFLKWNNKALIR